VSVRSDCSLAGAVSVPHAAASRIAAGRHKLLIADQTAPKDSHDREHLRALVPAGSRSRRRPAGPAAGTSRCWRRGPSASLAVERHNARGEQRGVRARAQLLRPAQQRTATIRMTETCAVRKDAGVLHASNRLAAFPAPTAGLVPRAKAGPTDIRALRVLATTRVPPACLRLAHRAGHPAESEHHRLRQRDSC